MANQTGKRYQCSKCGTEMIVTKGGQGNLSCCDQPMQLKQWWGSMMANQLGKRFQCEVCGTEVLCIKPGEGNIHCCGAAMKLLQPKVLPSAD